MQDIVYTIDMYTINSECNIKDNNDNMNMHKENI